jgi:hypothetical protein
MPFRPDPDNPDNAWDSIIIPLMISAVLAAPLFYLMFLR